MKTFRPEVERFFNGVLFVKNATFKTSDRDGYFRYVDMLRNSGIPLKIEPRPLNRRIVIWVPAAN